MRKGVFALASLTLLFLLTGFLLAACAPSQTPSEPTPGPVTAPTNVPPPAAASTTPTTDPITTPTNVPPSATAPTDSQPTTNTFDGQTLLQERCTVCHSLERVASKHKTADQWKTTVGRMVGEGAHLDAQEQQTLIDYLAQTYP
ncbi:MAG: hypothetical protein QMD04_14495 [Anaerolineales bacterium]|nr:hypothetical protein [Anaerolineales bacterium]